MNNQKGQTLVEYILLLAFASVTSYIVITIPLANFTRGMLEDLRQVMGSVILKGDMHSNQGTFDPSRYKALH